MNYVVKSVSDAWFSNIKNRKLEKVINEMDCDGYELVDTVFATRIVFLFIQIPEIKLIFKRK